MSGDSDRTHEPTARRLQRARDEARLPRSSDLNGAAVTMAVLLALTVAGGWLLHTLAQHMAQALRFNTQALQTPTLLPALAGQQLGAAFWALAPWLLVAVVAVVLAAALHGGFVFSPQALVPKWSKLDPAQGLARIFGPRAWTELGKSVLKVTVVSIVLYLVVRSRETELLHLGSMALEPALASAGRLLIESALTVALALLGLAAFDVPLQRYQWLKGMRMTLQEIRDEMKEAEGRPEIKAAIRRRQREIAQAQMIQRVRDADVIVTNPEHFAVAMLYDPAGDLPPVVVAKGADGLAARIREEGDRQGIPRFEAAPLARALYFTTDLEQAVPEALYPAVAQVIAWVFSLEGLRPGTPPQPKPVPQVPASMRFDTEGRRPGEAPAAPAGTALTDPT